MDRTRRTPTNTRRARAPGKVARIVREFDQLRIADRAEHNANMSPCSQNIAEAIRDEELGDARIFAELYRSLRCYDISAKRWYQFHRHYWRPHSSALADVDKVIEIYKKEADSIANKATEAAATGDNNKSIEKYRKDLLRRIRSLSNVRRQKNILEIVSNGVAGFGGFDRLGINGDEWDQKPYTIACENGVIELLREAPFFRFRDGRPEDYSKAVVPTMWQGINAPAPHWNRFLKEIFEDHPEVIPYMARVIGYALAGSPNEREAYILWGSGSNGKSTFVDILQEVLGSSIAGQIESELFLRNSASHSSTAARPDILALRGMRLAVASETGEGRCIDAAGFKRLTGMDTLTGRALFSNNVLQFRPTHTIFQLTNHKPGIDATDQAIWDRMRLIPFTRRFVKQSEKCPGDGAGIINGNLREELIQEASGILAWAVRGWCDYAKQGLNPPDVVRQTTSDYREEQNLEGRFLHECCCDKPNCRVSAKEVQIAFVEWCDEQGQRGNPRRLSELIRKTHKTGRTGPGIHYCGMVMRKGEERAGKEVEI